MDRRRIWLVIIAIVVAGVSITWATERFVSSHGVNTAAVVGFQAETQPPDQEHQSLPRAAAFEIPKEESVQPDVKEEAADAGVEAYAEEALEETVKSPLEAVGPVNQAESEMRDAEPEYGEKELKERLETVEQEAEKFQDEPSKNQASRYAAAEYVWNLWDRELNLIYSKIRDQMDDEAAELLRKEEVEWLKKRDLAADKAGTKLSGSAGQNTEYVRKAAEKTRDRCYELLETYGSLLDQTTKSD